MSPVLSIQTTNRRRNLLNSQKSLKILVTGGKGNLGSWIVRDLKRNDHEVWTLSRDSSNGDKFHLSVDLTNTKQCSILAAQKFDGVVHTASVNNGSAPGFSFDALNVNAFGTNNLLSSLNKACLKHFIYVSTFHVYGINNSEIDELTTPTPCNDYGLSHLFGEHYVRKYHATDSIPFTIIRLTNSYGCPTSYDTPQWNLLFNDLSKMAVNKKKLILNSTGEARRDFVWMGDVCNVISQLIIQTATNEVLNLSRGKSLRLLDMANEIQQAYFLKYGQQLAIEKKPGGGMKLPELKVLNKKLSSTVKFKPKDMFQQEANSIFEMLSD